nr:MAG TPA: hypothetical protein [Caudoviricetes sp.]
MIYSAKAIESCRSHYSFPPYYISLSCAGRRIGMDEPILFSCLFYREKTMDYKTNAEPRTVAPDGAAVFWRHDELAKAGAVL